MQPPGVWPTGQTMLPSDFHIYLSETPSVLYFNGLRKVTLISEQD